MDKKITHKIQDIILGEKDKFISLARDIWQNPELGFEERFACDRQIRLLKELGFEIKSPYAGLGTAYRADFGKVGPAFCFVAEYDALPGIGHACGHNLICAAAIAAGRALSLIIKELKMDGSLVVMGTPAEETVGGKVIMLENDALDGIDAVMMAHPARHTVEDMGSTALRCFDISFGGRAAHAAVVPEAGINALDAVISVFNGVNAWRQQLPESARVHGIITDGGKAPNIIPDYAGCRFFLRSTDDAYLDNMEKRFRDIVRGASLMTGTSFEINMKGKAYKSRKPNRILNRLYASVAEELGMNPQIPAHPGRGSSDFGDFCHARPGIHPHFSITDKEIPIHSMEFMEAANSDYAMQQMLKAATAMAVIGHEYISDENLRVKISEEHKIF